MLLDPNWSVERVANWLIIPQSASTRGQNRPLAPSLGGGGPRSIVFRPTGRLYPAIVSHHAINTALLQKPQIPNGQWRGSPIGQKFPNRHELKGKTGPQHPPRGPKHPQYIIFRPIGLANTNRPWGPALQDRPWRGSHTPVLSNAWIKKKPRIVALQRTSSCVCCY